MTRPKLHLLVLAIATLTLALPSQGLFDDNLVWDRSARFTLDFRAVDDDDDGSPALWAAAPGAATVYRFDENGTTTQFRGATGVRWGHEFDVAKIFPGQGYNAVIAADNGTETLSFVSPTQAGFTLGPIPVPSTIGDVLALRAANLDVDPESEVAIVGTNGWGFFDGASQNFSPVATGLPAGSSIRGPIAVRQGPSGIDSVIAPVYGPTGITVEELAANGNRTILTGLPGSAAQLDAIEWAQDTISYSFSNGSFTTPSGEVHTLDIPTRVSRLVRRGQPADQFPTVTPPTGGKEWFFVQETFGGNEEVYGVEDLNGTPQLRIQAPAGTGLDIERTGLRDLHPNNTPTLFVKRANLGRIGAYLPSGPADCRIVSAAVSSGCTLQIDYNLGAAAAGSTIFTLGSVSQPTAAVLPAFGPASFTFDALAVLWIQAVPPLVVDAEGKATLNFNVPFTNTFARLEFSAGYLAIAPNGSLSANQAGSMVEMTVF